MTGMLGLHTLGTVPAAARPAYDVRGAGTGIVHLGAGAFARAHVASYADDVVAEGNDRWGVLAVSQRSPRISDALTRQDGLYTVLEPPGAVRVIGSVRGAICAAPDPDAVVEALADPRIEMVTLTVTEQAYPATKDRRLRVDERVAAEIGGAAPRGVIAQLVRGLERRAAAGAGPLTVLCCDNLLDNGGLVRGLVGEFAARLAEPAAGRLGSWIEQFVSFPPTMVDRIVPATTDTDRADVARLIGVHDAVPVVTESYRQWVVGGPLPDQPAWQAAGVTVTDDVRPYEQLKLRVLNATHCLVAYLGVLAGYETIAAALRDPRIEATARRFVDADQLPTVVAPAGVDPRAYAEEVFGRFANPVLRHTTVQVATDGSKKLPQRLVPALRARRAAGALPAYAALTLAAWIRVLGGRADDGRPIAVPDPLYPQLDGPADRVVPDALGTAFGPDLAADREFVAAVNDWYGAISAHGVLAAISSASGPGSR